MRKATTFAVLFIAVSLLSFSGLEEVFAQEGTHTTKVTASVRWNNTNWHTTPHPKPTSFRVTKEGEIFGFVEGGTSFRQINVVGDFGGARIQRFEIDDHYHYIVEGEIAYTLKEISLALGKLQ